MSEINFHASSPIFRVSNLSQSIDYYVNKLGFSVDWNHEGVMASVSRLAANLMLCENDQGNFGTWVYIGVAKGFMMSSKPKMPSSDFRRPITPGH
jgi:hypothetical protein